MHRRFLSLILASSLCLNQLFLPLNFVTASVDLETAEAEVSDRTEEPAETEEAKQIEETNEMEDALSIESAIENENKDQGQDPAPTEEDVSEPHKEDLEDPTSVATASAASSQSNSSSNSAADVASESTGLLPETGLSDSQASSSVHLALPAKPTPIETPTPSDQIEPEKEARMQVDADETEESAAASVLALSDDSTIDSATASSAQTDLTDNSATDSAEQSELETSLQTSLAQEAGEEEVEEQVAPELVENDAAVDLEASVSAITGDNYSDTDQGGINLETGEAYSIFELIELTNILLVESNINVVVYDVTNPDELVADFTSAGGSSQSADQDPSVSQCSGAGCQPNQSSSTAEHSTDVTVTSRTGNNISISEEGDVYLDTGDAISVANLVQIINAALYYSDINIVIVNILVPWDGDVWLPFLEQSQLPVPDTISATGGEQQSDSQVVIVTDIQATASTGNNAQVGGQNYMQTGDAYASAEHELLANTQVFNQQLYQLLLHNQNNWSGNANLGEATSSSQASTVSGQAAGDTAQTSSNSSSSTSTKAEAALTTALTVEASTGGNVSRSAGSNQLITGNATAIANVIQMVNTEWWFSNYFFGIINILQPWSGDLWFGTPPVYAQDEELESDTNQTSSPSQDEQLSPAAQSEENVEEIEYDLASQSSVVEEEYSLASVSLSLEMIGNPPTAGQLAQFSARISNTSQQPVNQAILEQTLLDSSGQVLGQAYLELPSLLPGQTARFNFSLRTPESTNGVFTLQLVLLEGAAEMTPVSNVTTYQFYIAQSAQVLVPQAHASAQLPTVLGLQNDEAPLSLVQDGPTEAAMPQHLQSGFSPEPWMALIPLVLLLIFYSARQRLRTAVQAK